MHHCLTMTAARVSNGVWEDVDPGAGLLGLQLQTLLRGLVEKRYIIPARCRPCLP